MGLSREYSGTVPAFSSDFLRFSVYAFPSFPKKRQHINKFDPACSRDNPEKLFMFIGFFLPELLSLDFKSNQRLPGSFPECPRSPPDLPRSNQTSPEVNPSLCHHRVFDLCSGCAADGAEAKALIEASPGLVLLRKQKRTTRCDDMGDRFLSSAGTGKNCWEPPHLPPKTSENTPNSDHGLSFPSPETRTMVWVSLFPGKYSVWDGLGFGSSFSRNMLWVSSREVRNTGVGVDEWTVNCALSMRVSHPTMSSEILSSTGVGVWRKVAFPDPSSVLDKFQSAMPEDVQKIWGSICLKGEGSLKARSQQLSQKSPQVRRCHEAVSLETISRRSDKSPTT